MAEKYMISENDLVKMLRRHVRDGTDPEKIARAFLSTYGTAITVMNAVHGHVHEWVRPQGMNTEVCKTCKKIRGG